MYKEITTPTPLTPCTTFCCRLMTMNIINFDEVCRIYNSVIAMKKATPTSLKALPHCPYTPFCLHTTICHHSHAKKKKKIKCPLTLRGLSLFFKILPISNTGFYCIYFAHRSLSLPQTWLLFRHGVLLLPTRLPGLESLQPLRGIKSNAVLSLF